MQTADQDDSGGVSAGSKPTSTNKGKGKIDEDNDDEIREIKKRAATSREICTERRKEVCIGFNPFFSYLRCV